MRKQYQMTSTCLLQGPKQPNFLNLKSPILSPQQLHQRRLRDFELQHRCSLEHVGQPLRVQLLRLTLDCREEVGEPLTLWGDVQSACGDQAMYTGHTQSLQPIVSGRESPG